MRKILIIFSYILLIAQTFSTTVSKTSLLLSTLTSTYQTLTTTIPVYPSDTTTRTTNSERTTNYGTLLTSNWYQLSSKPNTNGQTVTTSRSVYTHDSTYQTTGRYETSRSTPWPTRVTTETVPYTVDTTYETTGRHETSRSTPWPTRVTTETVPYTVDTTYETTGRHETTRRTPWPVYTTTAYVTHDGFNPSRTTEPVDRTNYGTQSTIFWYRTTTMTPPVVSHVTTAETSSDYSRSTESWLSTNGHSPQYSTTSGHTTDYVDTTSYSKPTTSNWYPTTTNVPPSTTYPWESSEKIIIVEPFKNVMIRLARNVVLRSFTESNSYQVKLSCSTNMLDFLGAESHGDTLFVTASGDCDVEIQGDQFQRLDIGSVRSVSTVNYLNGSHLSIVTGEAATINLTSINYDYVVVMLFGDSDVILQGSTRVLDVTQLGTGMFDGQGLINNIARVLSRRHGLVRVKSTNSLSLFISESANVSWCSPQIEIKTDGFNWWNSPHINQNCD